MYRILGSPSTKVIKIVLGVSTVACVVLYLASVRNRLISEEPVNNRIAGRDRAQEIDQRTAPTDVTGQRSKEERIPFTLTYRPQNQAVKRNHIILTNFKLLQEDPETGQEFDLQGLHAAYDDVDTVLLFIGYPRSRHTLVSALLDAHPNIMLSNELNLVGFYRKKNLEWGKNEIFDKVAKLSYSSATRGRRAKATNGTASNYVYLGYKVPNQWQGTFDRTLKIIGDKVGWVTASQLSTKAGRSALKQLEDEFHVKAKFIHVIRNPFDNISTLALRILSLRKGEHTRRENIPKEIDSSIRRYFSIARNCQATKDVFGDRVLDIPGEDFVREPTKYLRKICDFLEISCSEDYLRDCASIVDPVPSKTRSLLVWTPKQIDEVYSLMQPLKFLKSYTFEN